MRVVEPAWSDSDPAVTVPGLFPGESVPETERLEPRKALPCRVPPAWTVTALLDSVPSSASVPAWTVVGPV